MLQTTWFLSPFIFQFNSYTPNRKEPPMKIVLCDDNKTIYDEISLLLNKFNKTYQFTNELLFFPKPSQLYDYMQTEPIDILFMDLEFEDPNEDGILWLRKIKEQFPQLIVIILTAYDRRYKEGYEVRAFRFMTKPIEELEFFDYLLVSMEELELSNSISIIRRGISHKIPLRDIYYLSAQSGGSELYTKHSIYYCEESLLQWEEQLPANVFFRCHSKFLVNLTYITHYEHQVLFLANGEKIPISRRRWKSFQLAYMKFDTKDYQI